MIDVKKIRKDFPMYDLHQNMFEGKPLHYLDNAATTFKPYSVIEAENHYYKDITANTRRGDYSLAHAADVAFEEARKTVARFINADPDCVCFTSGDSMGLNEIAYGLLPLLHENDEIVLSFNEHASNVLPWFQVAKICKSKIVYAPLNEKGFVTPENLRKVVNSHTKVVSLASVSNVLGYPLDVKALVEIAHSVGALYVDDGAQSVPHRKYDVKDMDVDFLCFSAHKMCGPTGVGAMYGKQEALEKISPLFYGGEMNARFRSDGYISLDDIPYRFESGTQNIAGVLGFAKACEYIESIGFDNIQEQEMHLKRLAVKGLKQNGNCDIYNEDSESGIVAFNIKGVFSQDAATYLSDKGVFIRTGTHCAKLLPEYLHVDTTARASFYFYNDEDDVKAFVDACKHAEDFLDVFFN